MNPTRISQVALVALGLVAGCGQKKEPSSDKSDKTVEKTAPADSKPEKKPLSVEFFGKAIAPPGALAKLKLGATEAEARAAAPELFPKPGVDFQLVQSPDLDRVSYGVGIDKETKKVTRMYVSVPAAQAGLITTAWGPGKETKDPIMGSMTYWFDATTGGLAYLHDGFDHDNKNLDFKPYLPAAKLLGEGPDTIGFAPQGILDATITDLRTRFPDTLVETDLAQAAEQQKKLGNFVGKDLGKGLAAKPSVRLDLLPTEWGKYWTRVGINWSDKSKVKDVVFSIEYGADGSAKDEIRALFDKKWGTPKEGKQLSDKVWNYRAKAPFVIVRDDTITHAWEVRLSTKPKWP